MTFALDPSLRDRWSPTEEGGWRCELPAGWGQGRSIFGGVVAAAAVSLGARVFPPAEDARRPLRLAALTLLRPTRPGPLLGHATRLRSGRTTTFIEVSLSQPHPESGAPQTVARASLVHTVDRPDSTASPHPDPQWNGPGPEGAIDLPALPGIIPEFVQQVQMRWVEGQPPFSGGDQARFVGWCRFRGPAGGPEGLLALLDVWPCPSLSRLRGPAPASTVHWTAHLLRIPDALDGWYRFHYETVEGRHGLHTVVGRLYDQEGSLLAWTEQLVAIFG